MKTTIRIAFLLIAMFITTVGYAGDLDGTWKNSREGTTVIISDNGANVTHQQRGWDSFHTNRVNPYGPNGIQWMEYGGGATAVYAVRPQGDKLQLIFNGGDQFGHTTVHWERMLSRVSN